MAPPLRREQAQLTDTIFALSSGRPPAAIGVIRVSGPLAFGAAERLAGDLPPPRTASLRTLRHHGVIDRALVLTFPGPGTATGEDLIEFHCHGGRAVIAAVEAALLVQQGLRRAEPGEFTRRALANGRIDLLEAEGLADLLAAETEAQRVAALAAAEGRLSTRTRGWLERIAELSARVELLLDYADEDDAVSNDAAEADILSKMADVAAEIERALLGPSVERLRAGVRVVIAGPPNAGKSTLLNLLAERDAAIVSPAAGTTRDRVEVPLSIDGTALLIVDTAGLTETSDVVEAIGVARAREALETADIVVWMGDEPPPRSDAIWLHARSDEPGRELLPPGPDLRFCRCDEQALTILRSRMVKLAASSLASPVDAPAMREHQMRACREAADALQATSDILLIADGLAQARRSLSRLLGQDATEVMLDQLFARFCVGK